MKKLQIISMGFLLVSFLATGCSQQPRQQVAQAPAKKKLVIGTTSGFYPFEMMDNSGKLIGYDIDLSNSLGEYLNMEIEIQGYSGIADVIAALQAQKVDIVIAAVGITEKRKETIDFSVPYFEAYLGIVVNNKHKDLRKWEELDKPGVVIAVSRGSIADQTAQKMFKKATVKQFDSNAIAGQAILSNQVDALMGGDIWVKVYKMYNSEKVSILVPQLGSPDALGIAINKGNKELLDKINAFLKKYKESGAEAKNYEKWFKSDSWKDLVPPRK